MDFLKRRPLERAFGTTREPIYDCRFWTHIQRYRRVSYNVVNYATQTIATTQSQSKETSKHLSARNEWSAGTPGERYLLDGIETNENLPSRDY